MNELQPLKDKHPLLEVKGLQLHYETSKGITRAVDGVSFELERGKALAVLGESGCGKSSLARALIRLLPRNVNHYAGMVKVDGVNVMEYGEEEFRKKVRWKKVALVMQAAMNALNPVLRVRDQVAEPLEIHRELSHGKAIEKAREACNRVGVPEDFFSRYPFELNGGMRQRVGLAMALAMNPPLILLDESTSALDVIAQANIMNVLKEIKKTDDTSFILITHDIATSSELADQITVMYAGELVEWCDAKRFFQEPLHPYSAMLLATVPRLRQDQPPESIRGTPPKLTQLPSGCRFALRCPKQFGKCKEQNPPLVTMKDGRRVKCWLFSGVQGIAI
jgi:oligopeptide/dipeptide ABC transporter ATP-binding protein